VTRKIFFCWYFAGVRLCGISGLRSLSEQKWAENGPKCPEVKKSIFAATRVGLGLGFEPTQHHFS
jgi:hypothetical protein